MYPRAIFLSISLAVSASVAITSKESSKLDKGVWIKYTKKHNHDNPKANSFIFLTSGLDDGSYVNSNMEYSNINPVPPSGSVFYYVDRNRRSAEKTENTDSPLDIDNFLPVQQIDNRLRLDLTGDITTSEKITEKTIFDLDFDFDDDPDNMQNLDIDLNHNNNELKVLPVKARAFSLNVHQEKGIDKGEIDKKEFLDQRSLDTKNDTNATEIVKSDDLNNGAVRTEINIANDTQINLKPTENANIIKTGTDKRRVGEYETVVIKRKPYPGQSQPMYDIAKVSRNLFERGNAVWPKILVKPKSFTKNKYHTIDHLRGGDDFTNEVPKNDDVSKYSVPADMHGDKEHEIERLLTTLSKALKKVMHEHEKIVEVEKNIKNINRNMTSSLIELDQKISDINAKYDILAEFNAKMMKIESRFDLDDSFIKSKEKEIKARFNEYNEQILRYMTQHRKLLETVQTLLVQNKHMNFNQTMIMKTLQTITKKQEKFSKMLKQLKHTHEHYTAEQEYYNNNFVRSQTSKPLNLNEKNENNETMIPQILPESSESMKINLFSIPIKKRIAQNQDSNILKDRDVYNIDDLVYKYYFNNTPIENVIKNNFLHDFVIAKGGEKKRGVTNTSKTEKNDLKTTILYPISRTQEEFSIDISTSLQKRRKRWINGRDEKKKHKNTFKHKRQANKKGNKRVFVNVNVRAPNYKYNLTNHTTYRPFIKTVARAMLKPLINPHASSSDPFLDTAKKFCKQIDEHMVEKELILCVEKSLRRLHGVESKAANQFWQWSQPVSYNISATSIGPIMKSNIRREAATTMISHLASETQTSSTTAMPTTVLTRQTSTRKSSSSPAFPDNEQLEDNLKELDLVPDLEGNVYYEGSYHGSNLISEHASGISDTSSTVDMDPLTLDIQSKRREDVLRLNQKLLKKTNKTSTKRKKSKKRPVSVSLVNNVNATI